MDFKQMIHPLSPEVFLEDHWLKRPLFVMRGDACFYPFTITTTDVEEWLLRGRVRCPEVRVVKEGAPFPTDTLLKAGWYRPIAAFDDRPPRIDTMYEAYAAGHTLALRMERISPDVAAVCRAMERALNHEGTAELFLTPPHARGFALHADLHHAFVLQFSGTKRWRVYDHSPAEDVRLDDTFPIVDAIVRPGDLLYIPAGFPHIAEAVGEDASLHVTAAVYCTRWVDLLTGAIQQLANEEPALAAPLPGGYLNRPAAELEARFREVVALALSHVDAASALARARSSFYYNQRPLADGHFDAIDKAAMLTSECPVEVRPGVMAELSTRPGGDAVLTWTGSRLSVPAAAVPAATAIIATRHPFNAQSLPGDLELPGRLQLVRDLVVHGLLRPRRGAPAAVTETPAACVTT